jgi:predicted RNase H-like nuclease
VRFRIARRFLEILRAPEEPRIVAVDIPIGLLDQIGPKGRGPERLIRPLLGARQSSVFSVPPGDAIYAPDFGSACAAALARSTPPRKLSKQLFTIVPKIKEVDTALRTDRAIIGRVYEVHPELAFWRLNGERSLSEPKKVKGGLSLRRSLLIAAGLPMSAVEAAPPRGSGADDLLDALACAMMARRIYARDAQPFPDPPKRDAFGLPIAIWA